MLVTMKGDDMNEQVSRERSFMIACRGIFGKNKLIATDFSDVDAVELNTERGPSVRLSFTVTRDALGKLREGREGLDALLGHGDPCPPSS